MHQAAGDHEQVPDAVPVAEALVEGKEHDAHRVEDAARCQPDEAGSAEVFQQRVDRHQHDPAHHRIDHQRHHPRLRARLDFLQHADGRQRPDDAEQRPAPRPAQRDQAEGCVAAGDQQVDRQVVELAQDALGPPANAVVDGRNAVEQDQRRAIDRDGKNLPAVAAGNRLPQQQDRPGERQ